MILKKLPVLAVCLGLFSWLAPADVSAQQPKKITEVEGITEYQLDNGVQVLLFPDASKPQFTVNMTILVGSRHEGYGETGMAHLLEHMLFRGTDLFPDTPKFLKDRGVLNMNGTTWYDRTNYYETLPAKEDNLDFAIQMEADRLINAWIKAEHLEKEMIIVRNEFERGENSPFRILMQRMSATAYEWHNYGKSTIGNRSDIERVPIENLRQFYRKFYQPDNVMVVIAGKFEPEKALELVEKYFGALKKPERELPNTYTQEPEQDGDRFVSLRRTGDTQMVGSAYHVPAASNEDYAAVEVLVNILGDTPSGPLYKNLVESEIASEASCMAIKTHDPGLMMTFVEVPSDGDLDKARKVMTETIENAAEKEITDERVKRAIRDIMKGRERQFSNSEQFAIALSEWRAYGDWRLYFLHRDRLEKVTVDDVKAAAKKYLKADNRTVGVFIPTDDPDRSPVPSTVNIAKLLDGYKGRKAMSKGESFDPTPENIEARTTKGTFASGGKYAFLPKKTRGGRLNVSGVIHYGGLESLKGKVTAAEGLPSMLTRGTKNLSFQEYQDRLDEIETTLGIGGGPGSLSFSIQTKRERMAEAIDLLRQVLREPALEGEQLDIVRRQQITQIESVLSDPQALAQTAIARKMSPYGKDDVRYQRTLEEEIEALKNVKIEDISSLYNEFLNGTNVEVAVVGDFDENVAKEEFEKVFADWNSDQAYTRIESPVSEMAGEKIVIKTPDKPNAVYVAALQKPMNDTHPDYEALLIGNYVLGGGPLSSRLADSVRKDKGLSYGVGSMFQADSQDESARFMMFAISNPANTPAVMDTIADEVKRMLESGVESEEMTKAKESYLNNRKGGRAQDRRLVGTLRKNLELGRDMQFYQDSDDRIESLTKEQIDNALRTLIDQEKLIIVTAGDFDKAEKEAAEAAEKEGEEKPAEAEAVGAGGSK